LLKLLVPLGKKLAIVPLNQEDWLFIFVSIY
jgi:hypothetical protein